MKILIIGQGLAGSLFAWQCEKAGHVIHIVDQGHASAATAAAAGIINPVTGRHYVKSWKIDTFLPTALSAYRQIETLLAASIVHETKVERPLYHAHEVNAWDARMGEDTYQDYLNMHPFGKQYQSFIDVPLRVGMTLQSAQIAVDVMITAFREYWLCKGCLESKQIDYKALQPSDNGVQYLGVAYDFAVCCEGWAVIDNPFFAYLPIRSSKGEVLIIKSADFSGHHIMKHDLLWVPLSDGTLWVGASNHPYGLIEYRPSQEAKDVLLEKINHIWRKPYEVVGHKAGLRPVSKHRRPLLGAHPEHPRLWIFNGLGAKGTSMAPLLSQMLLDAIEGKGALWEEVKLPKPSNHN